MDAFVLFSTFKRHASVLFLGFFLFSLNSMLYSSTFNRNNVIYANYYNRTQSIVYNSNMEMHEDSLNPIRDKNIPPLDPSKVFAEAVSGTFVGVACGFGAMYLTAYLGGDIGAGIISMDIGWILGNQIGVYIIGNLGDETGSLPKTLLYGTASSLGIQALAIGTAVLTKGWNTPIYGFVVLTAPILSSVVSFNMTRRYKVEKHGGDGLINFEDGKICFSNPGIFLHPIYRNELVGIKLVNVNF